jgi:hypothetical protein
MIFSQDKGQGLKPHFIRKGIAARLKPRPFKALVIEG